MGGELRSPSAPPFASSNACTRAWLSCSRERHSALGAALPRRARRGSARSALCTGGGSAGCIRCNPPPLLQVHAEGGALSCTGPPGCTPVGAARAEPRTLHAASCTRSSASPPVRAPPRPRRALVARRRAPRAPRRAERCTSLHGALCRCTSLHAAVPPHPTGAALAAALRPRDGWELSAAPCLLLTFGNATAPRAAPRRGEPHPRGLWLSTSN